MVFVIDALDECETGEDVRLILALLAEARDHRPIGLKVFVTSRPETPILLGFRQIAQDTSGSCTP